MGFFLNGHFASELNKNNALRGQLAVVFAGLLKTLWTAREVGGTPADTPKSWRGNLTMIDDVLYVHRDLQYHLQS